MLIQRDVRPATSPQGGLPAQLPARPDLTAPKHILHPFLEDSPPPIASKPLEGNTP